ncbi:FAD/NAD(P)-binding domain-containing protein [Polychaeton citri CBS 116435]|uniref:FAD/NAD(P)-binding domain-containing protein n=1 Tax=Polychaeton citri CBS 116435 TaxID=1314669 RepID=A0A9P4UV05_9PEZI|nr:FAD/NAD(P)-binding domain-containing protein [Polychaeton citri CBS 116435]
MASAICNHGDQHLQGNPSFRSQKRFITIQEIDNSRRGRERIVILGSGWAGYTLARDLDQRKFQVVVVSPRSYFVFTPLLASTSVGTLEFRTALEPVRSRRLRAEFFQGWGDGVDFENKRLTIEEAVEDPLQGRGLAGDREDASKEHVEVKARNVQKGKLFDMDYDKLVVAVGCYSQTFNTKGVRENAFFLKDVGDARRIRQRLLSCFETAALPTTSMTMKKQLLNFAVIGGGPTGIEWSAELHDLIQEDMRRLYPTLTPLAKITVYDVAPSILSMFDKKLSNFALDHFKRGGINVKTRHHVEELRTGVPKAILEADDSIQDSETCYTLKIREEGEIGVGMVVWSTGLMVNPFLAKALKCKVERHEKSGGIITDTHLRAKLPTGSTSTSSSVVKDVYALGDCAILEGTAYPATAQVASQKALWLAKHLNRGDLEKEQTPGFTYKDMGVMAYIGNWNAIMQSQGGDISGRVAWFIWRGAYLAKSVSWRNRLLIPTYWFVNWLFGRDVSRF